MGEIIPIWAYPDFVDYRDGKITPVKKEQPADIIPFNGKRVFSKMDQIFARWGIGLLSEEGKAALDELVLEFFNNKYILESHGINQKHLDQPYVRDRIEEFAYLVMFMNYPIMD